jgi:hypothetical protein
VHRRTCTPDHSASEDAAVYRFVGQERQTLREARGGGRRLSERRWRRIRILELLDRRWNLSQIAVAVGTCPREVRRVGWRYLELGMGAALTDDPRPKKLLDATQQAAIVAMVCGPPPPGHARWTVVLTAAEAQQRGVVRKVGRETIRRLFVSHALKPWREKKCGACRSSTRSTCGGWKRYWQC